MCLETCELAGYSFVICEGQHPDTGEKVYFATIFGKPEHEEDLLILSILGQVQARDLEKLRAGLPEVARRFKEGMK